MNKLLEQVNEARRELGFLTCEERTRTIKGPDGSLVDVAITVVRKRNGGFAFYRDGTGPFYTNRATRRRRHHE